MNTRTNSGFFLMLLSIMSLLPLYSKSFAALQSEQLISESLQRHKSASIKEVFESDFICTESSIISESQIDKYFECKPSQLETLLRQTVEEYSHGDGALVKFLVSPHPIYYEMTKKGNGHIFLPISQKEYKALKVYDSCDDSYLFVPSQAQIQIKDLNQDGLYDFDVQFYIKFPEEEVRFVHRTFIQSANGFFAEID